MTTEETLTDRVLDAMARISGHQNRYSSIVGNVPVPGYALASGFVMPKVIAFGECQRNREMAEIIVELLKELHRSVPHHAV